MKTFKPYLVIAGIALGVVILYPLVKPMLQKIPVIGGWL